MELASAWRNSQEYGLVGIANHVDLVKFVEFLTTLKVARWHVKIATSFTTPNAYVP